MGDFKGTKGKWEVGRNNSAKLEIYINGNYRAKVFGYGASTTGEDMANAQLIATAPELLEALIRLKKMYQDLESTLYGKNMTVNNWHLNGDVEHIDNFFEDLDLDAIGFSETIIAKALGREAQP